MIDELIAQQEHSLIVVRAHIEHPSTCDPSVMHKTVFLSPGFGNLLQYVNGQMSVQDLLHAMKDAGAEEKVLTGMKEGFHQLLLNEMCTV